MYESTVEAYHKIYVVPTRHAQTHMTRYTAPMFKENHNIRFHSIGLTQRFVRQIYWPLTICFGEHFCI